MIREFVMSSILKAMLEIKDMPYFRNHQAVSGKVHNDASHEEAVEKVLCRHNFTEHNVKLKKSTKTRDSWLVGDYDEQFFNMPNDTFISQPCGKNNSPDFIVKDNKGDLFFLECKSVKGGTPMYNSGIPKSDYIYILTSEKHNQTTVYLGQDCVDTEQEKLLKEHIEEHRRLDEEFNKTLEQKNIYGVTFYTRPMLQHKGGASKTDYFINKKRIYNEENVIKFIKQEMI
tara:strand:+ start:774 stop:1460 length:687 start_codon:yes stop_codon:yes gene_type:complete